MAWAKRCKHQGFAYLKGGYREKDIRIVCDLDGETHTKDYCRKCEFYQPSPTNEKGVTK